MLVELDRETIELLSDAVLSKITLIRGITKGIFVSKQFQEGIDKELGRLRTVNSYLCDNLNNYKEKKGKKK